MTKVTDTIIFDSSDLTPTHWSLYRDELARTLIARLRLFESDAPIKEWLDEKNLYPKRADVPTRIFAMTPVQLDGLLSFMNGILEAEYPPYEDLY